MKLLIIFTEKEIQRNQLFQHKHGFYLKQMVHYFLELNQYLLEKVVDSLSFKFQRHVYTSNGDVTL